MAVLSEGERTELIRWQNQYEIAAELGLSTEPSKTVPV
jgi:hypothetical protein